MELSEILIDFNRTKEQIRNKTRFRVPLSQRYDGLTIVVAYAEVMEYVVKELFNLTARRILLQKSKRNCRCFCMVLPEEKRWFVNLT